MIPADRLGHAEEHAEELERASGPAPARLLSGGWRTQRGSQRGSRAGQDGRIKARRSAALSARVLLDRWILRARLTQGEAADQIGISRVKMNQYLHGIARPSLEVAIRIEDTTGIAVRAWLIAEELSGVGNEPVGR